jgi:hypothetical protein
MEKALAFAIFRNFRQNRHIQSSKPTIRLIMLQGTGTQA